MLDGRNSEWKMDGKKREEENDQKIEVESRIAIRAAPLHTLLWPLGPDGRESVWFLVSCAPSAVPGLTHAPALSRCPQRHKYARAVGGLSCAQNCQEAGIRLCSATGPLVWRSITMPHALPCLNRIKRWYSIRATRGVSGAGPVASGALLDELMFPAALDGTPQALCAITDVVVGLNFSLVQRDALAATARGFIAIEIPGRFPWSDGAACTPRSRGSDLSARPVAGTASAAQMDFPRLVGQSLSGGAAGAARTPRSCDCGGFFLFFFLAAVLLSFCLADAVRCFCTRRQCLVKCFTHEKFHELPFLVRLPRLPARPGALPLLFSDFTR